MSEKKSRDILELVFGYSSIIGFVITVSYLCYSASKTNIPLDVKATVVALCLMNMTLAVGAIYIVRKYDKLLNLHSEFNTIEKQHILNIENLKSSQRAIAKVFHNINHEARNLIKEIHSNIATQDFNEFKETELSFKQYLLFLLDNIKEIFDVITSDQCSVCIKIIIPSEKEEGQSYIKTHYRDSISYRARSEIDTEMETYPYYENTAFKKIINREYPDRYWFCNDLKNEKTYNNMNPNWEKAYNATLVVPISFPVSSKEGGQIIVGFICVDNFKGGFNEEITYNLLASIANLSFTLYSSFNELRGSIKKPN